MPQPRTLRRAPDATFSLLRGFRVFPMPTQRREVTAFRIECRIRMVANPYVSDFLATAPEQQIEMAKASWAMATMSARPMSQQLFPILADDAFIAGEVDYEDGRTRALIQGGKVDCDSCYWICSRGARLATLRIRPVRHLPDLLISEPVVAFTSGDFARWAVCAALMDRHARHVLKKAIVTGYDLPKATAEDFFESLFRLWAERARGIVTERRRIVADFFDQSDKVKLPGNCSPDISHYFRGWRS